MRCVRIVLFAFLCLGAVPAQQDIRWMPDSGTAGIGNAFPWGSAGVRYQVIVPNTLLGDRRALVQDLFVAGDATRGTRETFYLDLEIRMGMTPLAAPVTSWNANNPSPLVVHRGPLRVLFEPGTWRGIGLPRAFAYDPSGPAKHLCLELIVWQVEGQQLGTNFYMPPASGAVWRAFRHRWTEAQGQAPVVETSGAKIGILLDHGNFIVVGKGCRSSAGGELRIAGPTNTTPPSAWPQLGKSFRVELNGAAPGSAALLALGSDATRWGSLALPHDLASVNAPGCFVWHDVALLFGVSVGGAGTASLALDVPGDADLWGARAFASWVNLDGRANGAGFTTSSFLVLIVGS